MNLAQIFTPYELAYQMVEMTFNEIKQDSYRILEPSCGEGAFVQALLDYADKNNINITILAVDIDPTVLTKCPQDQRVEYLCANTLLHDFGQEKFDIVIGNPPYVQMQSFGRQTTGDKPRKTEQQLLDEKSAKAQLAHQGYSTYSSMGDLYQIFYELGYNILKQRGIMAYITSNKWMRAGYGASTRELFSQKMNPLLLLDLGANVFESATVDSNIIVLSKSNNQGITKAATVSKKDLRSTKLATINFNYSQGWFIGSQAEIALKQKIERLGKPLKDWDVKINYGIKTGLNEAFIIDQETRDMLVAKDPRSQEIIKPILRGKDIKRYGYQWAGLYVIGTFPSLKLNIDDYPAVKEYLISFGKERLEQSGNTLSDGTKSRKKTGNKWFETQDQIAYFEEFEKEKIVYSEIVREPQFYLDKSGTYYAEATTFLLTGDGAKFLCGVFNSTGFTYFFKNYYAGGGLGEMGYRYKKAFLDNVPIPPLDTHERKEIACEIESLVDQILELKAKDADADIAHLENKIDELVFELYELSEEEIGLINA